MKQQRERKLGKAWSARDRRNTTQVDWHTGTGAAGGISGNLFGTEVSFQVGEGWRCGGGQWSFNARERSKQDPEKRQPNLCHQVSSAWGIQGAQGYWAGVWGGEGFWLPAEVEQEGAITGIWQGCMAGSQQRKVLLKNCDMLMRPMSSGNLERGKKKMRKRQIGSDCAISAQFPRGRVPCMYIVLFVCCLTCVSIWTAQGRLWVKWDALVSGIQSGKSSLYNGLGTSVASSPNSDPLHILCVREAEAWLCVCADVCTHAVRAVLAAENWDMGNPHTARWRAATFPSLLVVWPLHQPMSILLQAP